MAGVGLGLDVDGTSRVQTLDLSQPCAATSLPALAVGASILLFYWISGEQEGFSALSNNNNGGVFPAVRSRCILR